MLGFLHGVFYFWKFRMEKKTFKVVTLGCRTNQYESQAYAHQLRELGYCEAGEGEEADICIVNTCTVTESADASSRHQIRKLARKHPDARLVVTGCLVERDLEGMQALASGGLVVPNSEKESVMKQLFPEIETLPELKIDQFEAHTRAFVKVQDGCNSFCSYCIIPYVRGRSRSRKVDDVLKEIEGLVEKGFKEVVLTGINIGDFDGGEEKANLAELIRQVDALEGVERIRVSSIDPDEVDEELAAAILNGKKTCHSMHLVLQSGSNVVLKRMRRKYTRQIFFETVDRLKKASPDFTFTTDVIVGFPGETEQDFEETLQVIREVCFAKVHMFPYSDRPGTWAQKRYGDKVPPEVIAKRKAQLLAEAEKTAYKLREAYVGRKMVVLTENSDEAHPNMIAGHTENFLRVYLPQGHLQPNQLVEVECIENTPQALIGRLLS